MNKKFSKKIPRRGYVIDLDEVIGTDRDVSWGNGRSRRLILEKDNLPFSITDTIVNAGTDSLLHYKNHLEACYCISGIGEIEIGNKKYPLKKGSLYVLRHDRHHLRAKTKLRLVCIFSPPLKGNENHKLGKKASSY